MHGSLIVPLRSGRARRRFPGTNAAVGLPPPTAPRNGIAATSRHIQLAPARRPAERRLWLRVTIRPAAHRARQQYLAGRLAMPTGTSTAPSNAPLRPPGRGLRRGLPRVADRRRRPADSGRGHLREGNRQRRRGVKAAAASGTDSATKATSGPLPHGRGFGAPPLRHSEPGGSFDSFDSPGSSFSGA